MIKHKIFIYNIKKEEEWLEKYRQQGYQLINVRTLTGRYEFEKINEKEFLPKVKIDFRTFKKQDEFENYLSMFEDCGWQHIAGTKSNGVHYFKQIGSDADSDIFSDSESKAGRYKRISDMCLELSIAYIPLVVTFQILGVFDFRKILHLKELYYTPGLWEMKGPAFWRAFLFETPFALGRAGFVSLLFLLIVLMYAIFGIKSLYWYKKENQTRKDIL